MRLKAFARSSWKLVSSAEGRWLVLFSLGMGIALAWTYVPLFLTPLRLGMGISLFDTLGVFVTYFAVSAVTYLVNVLIKRRDAVRLLGFGLPHALIGVGGGVLLATDNYMSASLGTALGCTGAALAAFSSACAVLHASRLLKRLSPDCAVVACTGAFVAAAAITMLAAFMSGLAASLAVALVPLLSWVLMCMSDARVPYQDLSAKSDRSLMLVPFRQKDAWRYGAIALGLFLMGGWALNNAGQYDHLPQYLPPAVVIVQSVVVLIAFATSAALVQSTARPLGYDRICRVCVPVIALSILLEFMPENNAGYLDDLGVSLVFIALLLSDLMVWTIDVCAMRGQGREGIRSFAIMRAMTCGGLILSHLLVYGIKWAPLDKPKVAMTIGFLMLIVTIVCLPAADAKVLTMPGTRPNSLRDLTEEKSSRLGKLIVDHKLTARESEVLALMADDLDGAAIASELGVSAATVHTHVQHVYAKLDVHSRKELDRLLDEQAR